MKAVKHTERAPFAAWIFSIWVKTCPKVISGVRNYGGADSPHGHARATELNKDR